MRCVREPRYTQELTPQKEIVMKMNRLLLVMLVFLALTACREKNEPVAGASQTPPSVVSPTLLASGGSSTSGSGGNGGYVYIDTYGGSVKVLKSGTVGTVITVPTYTPNFGTDPAAHAVVSAGTTTTVVLDTDDFSGELCMVSGDPNLYIGDGNGTCGDGGDVLVTGLTVETGATLVLVDQGYCGGPGCYPNLQLSNDLVVKGVITSDASTGLYIEASTIDVESSGRIVTSATTTDASAGELYLGYGNGLTKQIINQGTIEAKGLGNGSGGYIFFEPDDLVVNTGTIDASGGDSTVAVRAGGSGGVSGELDVYVDSGDFYSSGIVRVNGGKGATSGGDNNADFCNWTDQWGNYCNSIYIETALYDNTTRNGDIVISGTWEANGGEGVEGMGGYGGYIYLQANALGAVTINADLSVKGGNGTGTGSYWGAYTYGIDIFQNFDTYGNGFILPASAGKISAAGTFDLRGGSGAAGGGDAGYLAIYGNNYTADVPGADIELVGFAAIDLNGGEGASGGSASIVAFEIFTYNTSSYPAGPITNEARIDARGGKANLAGNSGGTGGYVQIEVGGLGDPGELIYNSGAIDISGGAGDTGGQAYIDGGTGLTLYMAAVHITNSGALTANGGTGATAGGNGGNITLNSTDFAANPTTNSGTLSAVGGTGTTAGTPGTRTIDGIVL